ncbi:MAG: AMP-binding protein [Treponema sp.]|jgi:acetyl-CoA synthetase|nr:AMP-binding protein [Treponema sp.]
MLLEKFISRTQFDSYDDFYKNYSLSIPETFNFAFDVVDELAKTKPAERALVWCDEKGAEASFTFADMKKLSDQAANVFLEAGIKKGDAVMLILKRRYEYWPILLALHKIGAVAIPATHLLTTKDIVYRCQAADVAGIVCVDEQNVMFHIDEAEMKMKAENKCPLRYKAFVRSVHTDKNLDIAGVAEKAMKTETRWQDFNAKAEKASSSFNRPVGNDAPKNNDIMLLYFTSGTTGMPKMVSHNFVYPLGHILTAKFWQNIEEGGLHLTVADTGWAKAAWGKIYGQWLCEAAVFVYDYDKFDPPAMLNVISKNKVNTFCAPPTIYRFFIKEDLTKYDFSALLYCCVAGEPLNPEIYEQFKAATGMKLMEVYGQTEMTVSLATYPWMEPKPGSMGKPSPGYDIDIIRDDGTSCDMGEEGQVIVRLDKRKPAGLYGGYYRDDALTKTVFHDDAYFTGDVAWRDEDGFYWFVGRSDDVIKSSGYRIGPFEVESALLEHPAVLECAITGVPDPDRGTVVKATIILAKGFTASDELKKELQNHVKTTTAPYKYPRIVEFVTELPKTISGKIRRVQIREEDSKQ